MIQTIFKPDHIGFVFVDSFVPKYEATIGRSYFYWLEGAETWKLYRREQHASKATLFHTFRKYTVYKMDATTIIHRFKDNFFENELIEYAERSYRQYKIDQLLKPD